MAILVLALAVRLEEVQSGERECRARCGSRRRIRERTAGRLVGWRKAKALGVWWGNASFEWKQTETRTWWAKVNRWVCEWASWELGRSSSNRSNIKQHPRNTGQQGKLARGWVQSAQVSTVRCNVCKGVRCASVSVRRGSVCTFRLGGVPRVSYVRSCWASTLRRRPGTLGLGMLIGKYSSSRKVPPDQP